MVDVISVVAVVDVVGSTVVEGVVVDVAGGRGRAGAVVDGATGVAVVGRVGNGPSCTACDPSVAAPAAT